MQQKAFTLQNKGMNRDLSVSKAGESSAYENHNIRIIATDHDTLLSVTNERGNKEINLNDFEIKGTLVGWNVLNDHIILFTHEDLESSETETRFVLFAAGDGTGSVDDGGVTEGGDGNQGETPDNPVNPVDPDDPSVDVDPVTPVDPVDPDDPYIDVDPIVPDDPIDEGDDSSDYTVDRDDDPEPVLPEDNWGIPEDEDNPYDYSIDEADPIDSYNDGYNPDNPIPDDDDSGSESDSGSGDEPGPGPGPEPEPEQIKPDHIYRIDYQADGTFRAFELYNGNLGFSTSHPIESVVYHETEDIQKIYWVDGEHVLRFMNFMADADEQARWVDDNTCFDSNRAVSFGVNATISKDNSGNTRANGTIQYLLTYFNKHGQESGYVWISDLVYLSPEGRGGSPDGTNNNRVVLKLYGLDTSFTNFRIYSVFRSSLDGETVAYIVSEGSTEGGKATVIDDGAHLTGEDATRLLYLGSQNVHPGTLAHKDQTLFLGDLSLPTNESYLDIQEVIRANMFNLNGDEAFNPGVTWESSCISFIYSTNTDATRTILDIPYPERGQVYSYDSQLAYTSSNITTFKGGEKYRFALVFRDDNGVSTEAFWVGDKVNPLYPVVDVITHRIRRPVVECHIPKAVIDEVAEAGLKTVQLMIAEASYADRSVKAQGIVNPTMFNTWSRYTNRLYSMPSWISRPRGSSFAWKHFEPVHNSTGSDGEIQCNYWASGDTPYPYYRLKNYKSVDASVYEEFTTAQKYDYITVIYAVCCDGGIANIGIKNTYDTSAFIVTITVPEGSTASSIIQSYSFTAAQFLEAKNKGSYSFNYYDPNAQIQEGDSQQVVFSANIQYTGWISGGSHGDNSMKDAHTKLSDKLLNDYNVPDNLIVHLEPDFNNWCEKAIRNKGDIFCWNICTPDDWFRAGGHTAAAANAMNYRGQGGNEQRIQSTGMATGVTSRNAPSFFRKNLMFVDENVVTLDSPELAYEMASLDKLSGYNFRIVGIAKIDGTMGDYTVDASHGHLSGENLVNETFSGSGDGITSWPLWNENGLIEDKDVEHPSSIEDYSMEDYNWGYSIVRYWLHMWNQAGYISGFIDDDKIEYSRLHSKIFANTRYSYSTIYNNYGSENQIVYSPQEIRTFNYTSSQYVGIPIGEDTKYYDGYINESLSMPTSSKYPILYSGTVGSTENVITSDSNYLYTNTPIPITFASNPHAVISLGEQITASKYIQNILPKLFEAEEIKLPERDSPQNVSGPILPWVDDGGLYKFVHYGADSVTGQVEFRIQKAYSEETKTITLHRSVTTGDFNNFSYFKAWVKAKEEHWPRGKFYDIIRGEDGYAYLIDVSGYRLSNSNKTCTFMDADVLARTRVGVSGTRFTVNFAHMDITDMDDTSGDTFTLITLDVGRGDKTTVARIPFLEYEVNQPTMQLLSRDNTEIISRSNKYLFIGEIYYDFDADEEDTRYGGIKEADIESNRFVVAGPQYAISNLANVRDGQKEYSVVYGNQGDTYFQRWDCMRTKPLSTGAANGVIDVTSFMVETHINIDGRYDNLRGTSKLASVDPEQYGSLNPAYSQRNNFSVSRDLDDDFYQDEYHSSITWTLDKADSADIDEWTHITLANTLKLDGDKGPCNAIRRFQNSLIAFQDRAISEILFNSRTQISTTDGVPIEIANSGKVDGKRYITNKYGTTNKWSIVEGKAALYFVDNINKAFCAFNGNVESLSSKLGFNAWFRRYNKVEPWTPEAFDNIVSFYDRINSDVYLVGKEDEEGRPTLVYNELLGEFTSFYDYDSVPMMTNVRDRFISFKKDNENVNKLWLQNEGFYCNFFGNQYDYWVQYRVTPDPFGDKVWTNIEYRADFYRVLNENGECIYPESEMIHGDIFDDNEGTYQENTTFDNLQIWNEYQKTAIDFGKDFYKPDPARKKFRIWRLTIPRATATESNKHGLDRIRNPWINLLFKKKLSESADANANKDLVQLHDMVVRYFE